MRLARLKTALAALALALAGMARAEPPPDCAPPGAALVDGLIAWIGSTGSYDVAALRARPPRVSFCRAGTEIAYEGRRVIVDPDLRAAYDAQAHLVYLVEPWHADDPRDRSALLHELVHAAQSTDPAHAGQWPCVQAMEWDAYRIQARWLRLQGIEPGFDWFAIWLRAQCPRDIHP